MKPQNDDKMSYRLRRQYEEKYVKYLEKRYGKKRAYLFSQQSG